MTSAERIAQENFLGGTVLVDELVRSGVREFVVCPGSRSTPLAIAIARHPSAHHRVLLDERSASYFGLGLAKAKREPVAIVCSSGTAAANFLPAVVEAFLSRIPLIVLTADRPRELRENGAPQTIDQIRIYGSHVKWFFDVGEPATDAITIRHLRTVADRAVAEATRGPAGPVHLNCPYREPLMPLPVPFEPGSEPRPEGRPYVAASHGFRVPDAGQIAGLAPALAGKHGLILCGPQNDPNLPGAVVRLAARLGYPILADPLSGVRCGEHDRALVLDCYDAFLRDERFVSRHAADVVLRFGAMPTSKPVLLYLERHAGARLLVVDDDGWNEPTQLASDLIQADAHLFCEAMVTALSSGRDGAGDAGWAAAWQDADRRARRALTSGLAAYDELFEGKVFAELADLLPAGATVFAGNSMPVRDLDTFFPGSRRPVRFLSNRGANGIDGVVSSAMGTSAAGEGPVVLVIGDVSFYHDANGLFAAKRHGLNLTIVLLNNDGGGIFSFLSQASDPEHFEELFGTPHGLDFRPLAETYGARFRRVASWEEFRAAMSAGITGGGLQVVEVPTERSRNVTQHRDLWQAVFAALAQDREPEAVR
jgi:2-succinyl-5-enolpyruvyl-6-hydroxy-3-cyclohexene-1-carboxylate synthase